MISCKGRSSPRDESMKTFKHTPSFPKLLNQAFFPSGIFFNGKITVKKIDSIFLSFCYYGLYNNNKKEIFSFFSTRLSVQYTKRALLIYSDMVKRRQITKHLQYNKKNSHTILYYILLLIVFPKISLLLIH